MKQSCRARMATDNAASMTTEDQKKGNLRLAIILASIAAVFFLGFIAKMWFLGH
jgi:hypothetical protein